MQFSITECGNAMQVSIPKRAFKLSSFVLEAQNACMHVNFQVCTTEQSGSESPVN